MLVLFHGVKHWGGRACRRHLVSRSQDGACPSFEKNWTFENYGEDVLGGQWD